VGHFHYRQCATLEAKGGKETAKRGSDCLSENGGEAQEL
jgi:hypothetical protein